MIDRLLTVEQVAEFVAMHPETIRKLARQNRIPAIKLSGAWRFDPEALRRWMDAGGYRPEPSTQTRLAI